MVFLSLFPILTDSIKMIYYVTKSKKEGELYIKTWFREAFKGKTPPPMAGMVLFGNIFVCVNDPALLEEFYVKQNKFYSKHSMMQTGGAPLLYSNISAMSSNDPEYPGRRKALSTAFFKSKLEMMSTIVKEVTLQHIGKTFAGMKIGDSKVLDMV